jgi:hypothetical protein
MATSKLMRFEQVPIADVLKIAKIELQQHQIKDSQKAQRQSGGKREQIRRIRNFS